MTLRYSQGLSVTLTQGAGGDLSEAQMLARVGHPEGTVEKETTVTTSRAQTLVRIEGNKR